MINIHNLMSVFSRHDNWPEVKKIILTLNQNGFMAYLAGGCVRDALLNRTPKDFDVATSARTEEVLRMFPKGNKQGKAFGVVAVFCSKGSVEVATFRKDGPYADGRHPQYVEFLSDREDALRRDFTVNALFYDIKTDKVIDYVGGVADLKKKIIRTVGKPEQRFQEDHLRILRALRFSIKLDFAIEKITKKAVFKKKDALLKISRERVYEECLKILKSGNFTRALSGFKDLNLLNNFLFPVISVSEQTFNNKEINWDFCREFCNQPVPVELMREKSFLWIYVFFPVLIQTENEKWKKAFSDNLKNWKFPSALIREVNEIFYSSCCILGFQSASFGKKLRILNSDFSRSILFLCKNHLKARKLYQQARDINTLEKEFISRAPEGKLPKPLINGNDLKALGILEDKNMAHILESLYDKQLERKITEKEILLETLK